mgnify:CR=1 FL=1
MFSTFTPETGARNTCFKKAAIQEGPGRFREGKREGRNGTETVSTKNPQSRKVREGSGKGNGKVETNLPKTRNPGRSGKVPGSVPGREHMHLKFRFYAFWDDQDWFSRNQPMKTCILLPFLLPVSGPVSDRSKTRNPGRSGKVPGSVPGS